MAWANNPLPWGMTPQDWRELAQAVATCPIPATVCWGHGFVINGCLVCKYPRQFPDLTPYWPTEEDLAAYYERNKFPDD